jgi:hypothetical protein
LPPQLIQGGRCYDFRQKLAKNVPNGNSDSNYNVYK